MKKDDQQLKPVQSLLYTKINTSPFIHGQFHESVNLGVKILKLPDSHFHILIS